MTEEEWLASEDPVPMMYVVRKKGSRRKLRLFAIACCYRTKIGREDIAGPFLRIAERYADGQVTKEIMRNASHSARQTGLRYLMFASALNYAAPQAAFTASFYAANAVADDKARDENLPDVAREAELIKERVAQGDLLRDIFGNPFRPVAFSPDWRTDTAVTLARAMYDSRDFSAMPILADALQDAGCDSDDVLSHCRDATQLHVRGCWVVDLVLGKE